MITHKLKIGQRIWDCHDERWGTILLIGGEDRDEIIDEEDMIILYKPDNSCGECETWARDVYPLVGNKLFHNKEICLEINKDEFESDYDYYCPSRDENCFEIETTAR